ncbi:hypothetical protein CDL15_Pgr005262 [Punica granatum]|uniref:Uncharacterized protein n=1 Tax=Punica granatum TaxID=22663 RepID=A0A218XII3_PUNGR|nr:hypothetical protein CDL15_Pgr005262 [Punica granatum]
MDLECLNDEDLNEPNIAMRRVDGRSGDSAPQESVLPCSDVRGGIWRPSIPDCSLCMPAFVLAILLPRGGSFARRPRSGTVAREDLGTLTGIFSVRPECLEMLGDYCEVLRDRCDLCFPWKYPKARREAFATTETYFG